MPKNRFPTASWSERLRVDGPVDLAAIDTSASPGVLDKDAAEPLSAGLQRSLSDLQERLFASSLFGGERAVLLVIQGMDTAGKGGVVKRVAGSMDPQGITHHAFKRPTPEELAHDFLWRVRTQLPKPGHIGIFDRSHYEDVLVPLVRGTIDGEHLAERYAQINEFEHEVTASGTAIVKVMLHVGRDEQKKRLLRRLDRSDKHWKFSVDDIDDRALWPVFQDAYAAALSATSTEDAPWHVVPADRKWYSALAVQQLVDETLRSFDLGWPRATYDVDEQRTRLLTT
jgi:PPK2 family polyphosphate:nucleotide phosphotransferase